MLSKVHSIILLVLLSTTLTIDARRSRIDLPIANADEAPVSDNMATASGSEPQEVKVPAPATDEVVSQAPVVAPSSSVATSTLANTDSMMAVGEIEEECDPDMIGFEIVTG